MNSKKFIIIIIILFLISIFVLGYIGGKKASSPDSECEIGLTSLFCWEWHTIEIKTYDTFNQVEYSEKP